jgi:transcriptional regulator with XRE-family HTH domain
MLQTLLQNQLNARNLSSHGAAEEIGCSHTTILRAMRGERIDIDTLIKIANWLHVRPSELLNSMDATDTSLADAIAVLLSHSPELEAELKDAAARVRAGVLDQAVLTDIVSYALYKLRSGDNSETTRQAARTGEGRT